MPTITISKDDLCQLVGRKLSQQDLLDVLVLSKIVHEETLGDEMTLEICSDRPDLLSAEGIAREICGLLEIETGLKQYKVTKSDISLKVDRSVKLIRPHIVSALVEGVVLSDLMIRQLMQLQEKLHLGYGRNRRKVSVGIHDIDKVNHSLVYAGIRPEKICFTPLGETRPMNGKEILQQNAKGKEYRHIIESYPRYPLLFDSNGEVLSLPPIINGVTTTVNEHTKNLLLDVTGTDPKLVRFVLNMMAANLADRGATIKSVRVTDGGIVQYTPDLSPSISKLNVGNACDLLGLELKPKQVAALLRKMRYGIKSIRGDVLLVQVPAYRSDIMHEVDLIEDVAIGYGIAALDPEMPFTPTIGHNLDITGYSTIVRDIMIGCGFQEIVNFVLTNPTALFDRMNRQPEKIVEIANPVARDYSVLRNNLLPGLMDFLSYNKHVSYPQKVFECGDTVTVCENTPTRTLNRRKLAAAISNHVASYEDIQSVLYSLLKYLKVTGWSIAPAVDPSFIDGRCAEIFLGSSRIGVLGEINPSVLLEFGLENPVAGLEIDLQACMDEDPYRR